MKKLIQKIRKKINKRWEQQVKKWYQNVKKKETFILDTKLINVKKGTGKYRLFLVETTEGNYRFNLGRHLNSHEELQPRFDEDLKNLPTAKL
jgi:hypothetical protein